MQHTVFPSLGLYEHYFSTQFCDPCRWRQLQPPLLTFQPMTNSKRFQIEPPAGTVIFGHLLCVRGAASAYLQSSEVMGSMVSVHQTTVRGQWFVRGGSAMDLSSQILVCGE